MNVLIDERERESIEIIRAFVRWDSEFTEPSLASILIFKDDTFLYCLHIPLVGSMFSLSPLLLRL